MRHTWELAKAIATIFMGIAAIGFFLGLAWGVLSLAFDFAKNLVN